VDHRYRHYIGNSIDDGVLVVDRCMSLAAWSYSENESWIFRVIKGEPLVLRHGRGWITGFWVSPSSRIYYAGDAGDALTGVYVEAAGDAYDMRWERTPLDVAYSGVWGLDDDFVFAWGGLSSEPKLAFYDGRTWTEVESPGPINAMHGVARDLVYAVGDGGLAAWWDGAKWNRQPTPTRGILNAVRVVSDAEIYATGPCDRVLAGSIYGWSERYISPYPTYDVTKHGGDVWVALGSVGVGRLTGNTFDLDHEDIGATRLWSGDTLIAVTNDAIYELDGERKPRALPLSAVQHIMDRDPPAWEKPRPNATRPRWRRS
jgi:hypothetical protein